MSMNESIARQKQQDTEPVEGKRAAHLQREMQEPNQPSTGTRWRGILRAILGRHVALIPWA